jgi:hypothetical protein
MSARPPACTAVGLTCAVAAAWLAFTTYQDVSMAGFPDGHVTALADAVDLPLRVVMWMAAGFGVLFVALAFSPMSVRVRTAALLGTVVAFALVAVIALVGIPWYFGTHLGLDNGTGG